MLSHGKDQGWQAFERVQSAAATGERRGNNLRAIVVSIKKCRGRSEERGCFVQLFMKVFYIYMFMDGLWDEGSYDVHRHHYPPTQDQNYQPEKWPTVIDTKLPQILCLFEVVLRLYDHLFLFVVLHVFGVVCPACPLLSFYFVSSSFVVILRLFVPLCCCFLQLLEYLFLLVVLNLFEVICVLCCCCFLSLMDFLLSVCSCSVSLLWSCYISCSQSASPHSGFVILHLFVVILLCFLT